MLTPELSVTQVDEKTLKYMVRFVDNRPMSDKKTPSGETEAIEQLVSKQDHDVMMYELGMRSLQDFAERFGDVCDYFIRKKQYVDFEEIKNEHNNK